MAPKPPTIKTLRLSRIMVSPTAQSRVKLDDAAVNEYAEAIAAGSVLPPVTVFFDGREYWLADGFHRHAAHLKSGRREIAAEVRKGTRRDAILCSVGANAAHGVRRTDEDKRRAVKMLLADKEWREKSARWIADTAHVSQHLVHKLRDESGGKGDKVLDRRGRMMPARVGKKGSIPFPIDRIKYVEHKFVTCPTCMGTGWTRRAG